ncbi:fibronectin type III domain-containing protein [Candidatus Peregrinibacteria bacterium]|nr:fibronectin type III domain-containing protein [Candidatus Peregrinibacteria bacterium]
MKQKLLIAMFALWLVPTSGFAISIQADDTVAGLGTDIDITDISTSGGINLVMTPPFGNEIITEIQSDSNGTAHVQISARDTEVAGVYTVIAEKDGKQIGSTSSFEVLVDGIHESSSSISSSPNFLSSDGKDYATVTIVLRDKYGNPIKRRPLQLISTRSSDRIEAVNNETDETGEQKFKVKAYEQGEMILRAIDLISGKVLNRETIIDVDTVQAVGGTYQATTPISTYGRQLFRPGSSNNTGTSYNSNLRAQLQFEQIDHFVITAPAELNVNEDTTLRIAAVDVNGNLVEDYTGVVLLSSTDPSAFLPLNGTVTFRPQDLGEKQLTLGLRFRTADNHILHAQDSERPEIIGETIIKVTGGPNNNAGAKLIQVTEPADNALLNSTSITVTGEAEPFVNLIVTGGTEPVNGETDIYGEFSIDIELDPEVTDHVLRVRDEAGLLDSGDISFMLDTTAPEITRVSLSPEKPIEGTDALLVIELEDGIEEISAELDGEILILEKALGDDNKYQHLFTAPDSGIYDLVVTIVDEAGNSTIETTQIEIGMKGLPKVQNVTSNTDANAVNLQWDAVTEEPVEAYRVYVGETPTEFSFSLETGYATTSVQIAGLQPGMDYYFAITALKGERESDEKSDVIKATMLGLSLKTTAQKDALMLDWSNMQVGIPLSSFVLEYGIEPEVFIEKRILNGELRNYTIRDLLKEVKYFVRITPVSVTGELMSDLIAEGEGIPMSTGEGFVATSGEPVPSNIDLQAQLQNPGPINLHGSAPATPGTGLPSFVWLTSLITAAGLMYIRWKRKKSLQRTVAFLQDVEKRYHS